MRVACPRCGTHNALDHSQQADDGRVRTRCTHCNAKLLIKVNRPDLKVADDIAPTPDDADDASLAGERIAPISEIEIEVGQDEEPERDTGHVVVVHELDWKRVGDLRRTLLALPRFKRNANKMQDVTAELPYVIPDLGEDGLARLSALLDEAGARWETGARHALLDTHGALRARPVPPGTPPAADGSDDEVEEGLLVAGDDDGDDDDDLLLAAGDEDEDGFLAADDDGDLILAGGDEADDGLLVEGDEDSIDEGMLAATEGDDGLVVEGDDDDELLLAGGDEAEDGLLVAGEDDSIDEDLFAASGDHDGFVLTDDEGGPEGPEARGQMNKDRRGRGRGDGAEDPESTQDTFVVEDEDDDGSDAAAEALFGPAVTKEKVPAMTRGTPAPAPERPTAAAPMTRLPPRPLAQQTEKPVELVTLCTPGEAREVLGYVSALVVLSAGDLAGAPDAAVTRAVFQVRSELRRAARDRGADAVWGVHTSHGAVGGGAGAGWMVLAEGTAVRTK